MSNEEIMLRLEPVGVVYTPVEHVRNDIVARGADYLEVVSTRTGRVRRITCDEIRRGGSSNGCLIAALRQIFGPR